jgi:hypothetical protein
LNRLAYEVERALDMEMIFGWVGLSYRRTSSIDNQSPRESVPQ